ncbi:sugar phosphate isomerase/epimerase family protein [Longimycelium tulufanense]|uniref:sugar phosphate isomerase/epimerase family protein n=1 Tax=Longimycelium tulufanense TaxID=907463 RepID=UPI00166DB415|nr:sugar phosphate isomerase/epimerase [Longimycelium tulufanense]
MFRGREWSLFDWRDRCAQAARVGLRGLGLWHADLEHQLEQRSLAEIRQIFQDHGLETLELEFLDGWYLDKGTEDRAASDSRRALLFEAAAELGAHHIKVGNIFGVHCEISKLAERFAELCADAAKRHDAPITYELISTDLNANTLDRAIEVVRGAEGVNGGLTLDTWHLAKLGIAPEDLRRIPRQYVTYVELSDGMSHNMSDLMEEAVRHRQLPGEGEFDLEGYIAVLQDLGYGGPWGVEVLSDRLRALPITEIFSRTWQTASAQF